MLEDMLVGRRVEGRVAGGRNALPGCRVLQGSGSGIRGGIEGAIDRRVERSDG